MSEYLSWSLREALKRSSTRVVDLFRAWDEDKSGTVDKKEFHAAVRALGFDVAREDTDAAAYMRAHGGRTGWELGRP